MLSEMAGSTQATSCLGAFRVLDLSRILAGPWASQILGDLGADVIKVEQRICGDETRKWGPPFLQNEEGPQDAAYFLSANRNKKSIAIDFSRSEGADLVRQLAMKSDVLIENFKVGKLAEFGLDYNALKLLNPSLIYCSITGFGQTGPYASRSGYDILMQGMSGLMSITGRSQGDAGEGPTKVGLPVSDLFTGLYACISILAALQNRTSTGEGQHIDCALLDCQVSVMVNQAMNYLVGGVIPRAMGNSHPNVVPYRDFQTADGHVLVACGSDSHFQILCRVLALPTVALDTRFATNAGRSEYRHQLENQLSAAIANWTTDDLVAAMHQGGVPGGPINRLDEILNDPQIEARGLLQSIQRDDGTSIPVVGYPGRLSRTPASYRLAPPRHAQHTDQVLAELLGLSEVHLCQLNANGVIGRAPLVKGRKSSERETI